MSYISQANARKAAQEILPGLNVQTNKMGYRQVYLPIGRGQNKMKLGYGYGTTWEEALESAKQTKEKLDKQGEEIKKDKQLLMEAINSPEGSKEEIDADKKMVLEAVAKASADKTQV